MKEIVGYLIDRTTGLGIAAKTVSFKDLSGVAIAAGAVNPSGASTGSIYQSISSVTDGNGRFFAKFEFSPGPVNITVDVSGSEKKVRKWDEKAQAGSNWMSDLSRYGEAFEEVVIKGYLNELVPSIVSGHTYRIGKGAAAVGGGLLSIEDMGGAAGLDITGTANNNVALNPRIDLVTLRQYKDTAVGQNAGRQAVVVTEGVSSGAVPATPSGADFTDIPIVAVSTAYLASTKTIYQDLRRFTGFHPALTVTDTASVDLTLLTEQGLKADIIFAGTAGDFGTDGRAARYDHSHSIPVQSGDVTVVAKMTALDFDSAAFTVTESPVGEANVNAGQQSLNPPGSIVAYTSNTPPTGWLLCDGSSLLRASFAALFAVIGTSYGAADGTHFTLPNLKGMVLVGRDTGNVLFDNLADTGGEYSHLLTANESGMPAHSHGLAFSLVQLYSAISVANGGQPAVTSINLQNPGTNSAGPAGAISFHNNIQPYVTVNWIIKT